MQALLHTHTFVLLGCGLSDPDIQVMFEDYKLKFEESAHYMTYSGKLDAKEIELIQRNRGINIIKYSAKGEHAELKQSLKQLVEAVNTKRQELAHTANW